MAPILLMVLGLTAEIGRSFFIANQVTNANREGALWAGHHFSDKSITAAIPGSPTWADYRQDIITVISNEESTPLVGCPAGDTTVKMTPDPGSGTPLTGAFPAPAGTQTNLTIEVDCDFRTLIGVAPIPSTLHLVSKVTTFVFD